MPEVWSARAAKAVMTMGGKFRLVPKRKGYGWFWWVTRVDRHKPLGTEVCGGEQERVRVELYGGGFTIGGKC